MSHATISEKLGILYDLFDLAQSSENGLKHHCIIELAKAICERTLYHQPDQSLYNSIQYSLSGHIGQVYRALWTSNFKEIEE